MTLQNLLQLVSNNSITSINLQSNSIGDEEAKALAEALKTNKSVTSIDLEGNNIGTEGAIALADALKINYTVVDLIIS